ncbi:hypothetical protein GKZ89_02765 [Bacillus mangrovi]|uniref:CheW-like domain-containing protein n=1 Tax=Metabacillus mangrovi TaxID=1491830 RepID=A0A7X2S345_9BACI|nr:chemotaxis protein CheW [Metabacillus mangrovi]MTH52313.1 hypothetical protein [Metabacillus mangrovi]
MKAIIFQIQEEDFGIPIEDVRSIEKIAGMKQIPNTPDYAAGVMLIRGELIPILDVTKLFGREEKLNLEQAKVIAVQTEEIAAGLLVKDAKEIADIEKDQIKPLPAGTGAADKWFSSIAMMDSRLITMVNPTALLGSLDDLADIQEEMKKLIENEKEEASV